MNEITATTIGELKQELKPFLTNSNALDITVNTKTPNHTIDLVGVSEWAKRNFKAVLYSATKEDTLSRMVLKFKECDKKMS
ncbi:hypothetical protein D0469_18655 [Peribacillus saganii]|uniref:Uncharacterized protein n=1 Tax=Peribacillus saganii TaxID=2303992 RepID=A0A372LDT3_9BACI|nr:hypothetical protein [Peribacillus saganii]RFU64394.1 hypothetical protein D0469_18655 [Peribacillus saganii]